MVGPGCVVPVAVTDAHVSAAIRAVRDFRG